MVFPHIPRPVKIFYFLLLHLFAIVGFVFIAVFFAIRFKLTNVSGNVDSLSGTFQSFAETPQVLGTTDTSSVDQTFSSIDAQINKLTQTKNQKINELCTLNELSYIAPKNVNYILTMGNKYQSPTLVSKMILAVTTHLDNQPEFQANITNCVNHFDNTITQETIAVRTKATTSADIFYWPDQKEWSDVAASITKDKDAINKAASVANIEPRLITSSLMVEQLRLFYSQRELYKKYFEPLKILANSNKISLGVMAIKEDTAIAVENHLKDAGSPYYLGPEYAHLLDYAPTESQSQVRYDRLTTTANNHYWNYLYGALYLKQMMIQWQKAGFPIDNRPEIIGTLFNVGFPQSNPNASPQVGGSTVKIGDTTYSFGRLSYEFYYSSQIEDIFPYSSHL